jgi:hypothetical protein
MSKKYKVVSSHKKNDFASYLKDLKKKAKDPYYLPTVSSESAVDYLFDKYNNLNKGEKK